MTTQSIFSENGSLKNAITGFSPRPSQLKMAETIEKAIEHHAQLVVEAGTGTGKTFAYLIPVFLSDKKTIISTGTKNLQDQLFFKDIPVIKKILTETKKIVLLKGRANYLCQLRLQRSQEDGRFASRELVSQLHTIQQWANQTIHGDIAELNEVPEDSGVWPYVTSTADNCLGQECEFYSKCHVLKARQQALAADIVVVNHHLFFADMALQEEGFGELLPGAEVVIFDEAHHLPDIASQFFSTYVTGRQLNELARDTEVECSQHANDMAKLVEITTELQTAVTAMRAALGPEMRRYPWPEKISSSLQHAIDHIKSLLKNLEVILKEAAVRSKGLENCWKRCVKMLEQFHLLTGVTPENNIHWFETFSQSFSVQLTPMIVADFFKNYLQQKERTWIFTSATLTVKNNFNLFVETLGLNDALQLQLKSPFDYQTQALLYAPRGIPDPRSENFTESMIQKIIPVLETTQGRAFILFTSYKAMDLAATFLKDRIEFPLLLQGTVPKRELIEQFKNLGNAVLLGTSSFWYGVDVRGDALSCVIIDKLPFSAPDDPILQARIKMLRKKGIDPFVTYQLPQAVLTLKQGAGRLIRDAADRGILVVCDPRLVGSWYGEVFLQSLPEMPRTRDFDRVREFLHEPISH
jgi:ATP-dependent DNA helicase DinG